jgi:hypothetical protein
MLSMLDYHTPHQQHSPVLHNACHPVSKDDLLPAISKVSLHLAAGVVEHIQAVRVGALPHSNLHTQTCRGPHAHHSLHSAHSHSHCLSD